MSVARTVASSIAHAAKASKMGVEAIFGCGNVLTKGD